MFNGKFNRTILKNKHLRQGAILSLFITVMLLMPSVTFIVKAADIIVDDDGTGDYTTIQAAINAASNGDTIWVKDGSYNEQLTIGKSLTIIADNGATPTIYASTYSPGIDVTASDVTFEGFKIYGNSDGGGPTIRASSGANGLKVRQNTFTVISGRIGSTALSITSGVQNVEFSSNTVNTYNIGVLLQAGSTATIPSGNNYNNCNYSVFHAALVQGTDIYYGTIQNAIANAIAGNTVNVLAGTYVENVNVDRSLTLKGAHAGVKPINGRSGDESIIDGNTQSAIAVSLGVSNVTINGFTLTISNKSPTSNEAGVLIRASTKNILVTDNIIENITDGPGADTLSDETYGVMVYGHTGDGQSGITITDNLIQNIEEYGIAINDNTSNVIISGNLITNLTGSSHSDFPDPSWPSWICSAIHLGGQVGPVKDVTISSNILNTNVIGDGSASAAGSGISFAGIQEVAPPNRVWAGYEQISIRFNRIYNNTMGIIALAGMSNGTIGVNSNNISDNSEFGINNIASNASFNATDNWWGDITGPYNTTGNPDGTGDNTSGNVTFWPWCEFGTEKSGYSIPPTVEYNVGTPQANGGYIISDKTEIEITAHDNESGMYSLTYRVWNTTYRWSEWKNYTSKIKLSGEGKHMIEYNATDKAGTKEMETETHYVDTKSPEVKVLYPNGGEYVYGSLPIQWTSADKILDQEQTRWNDSSVLTEDYPGHIQSFIPTEDRLNSVQLLLVGDDANVSVKIFSEIFPVPITIAQSSQHLQDIGAPGYPVWMDFPFDSSVDLDTSKTYYIGVTQHIYGNFGFSWYYLNSSGGVDPYNYGHAWLKKTDTLVNMSEWDWGFRTMVWNTDLDITVEYSMTGVSPWSTIAEDELNDGHYSWDTTPFPDGESYRVRIIAEDAILNAAFDTSDDTFTIDNTGPSITNIVITDTSIGKTEFTKDGDNLEITATILGNPVSIEADLSGFGGGSDAPPTSFTGTTAKWVVTSIVCSPSNGPVTVTISALDSTGDTGRNTGSIVADNADPVVYITRPGAGLYIMDSMRLLPFSYPLIIGQITVSADANDNGSGIEKVEFYLENKLEASVTEAPYNWLWDQAATGFFNLEVTAYDNAGHSTTDEVRDLFILNFDIFGH